MDKKNRTNKIYNLLIIILLIGFMSCEDSKDDDSIITSITILDTKLNDSQFIDNTENVPVNSSFEVAFSSSVTPDKFENAFSLNAGSENVPYTLQYLNQSTKVLVNIENMVHNTSHTIGVNSGDIGENGRVLENNILFNFKTIDINSNLKTPCLTASQDCKQQLIFTDNADTELSFDYYSNYDFKGDPEFIWDFIEQVVVVVHGAQRNSDDYFMYMVDSFKSINLEKTTLIISPHFQDNQTAQANGLVWNDSGWREGVNASNNNSSISSFTVMDSLMDKFSNEDKFPNLKNVFVSGHSSGAAYVQHYALANKVQDLYPEVDYHYVVANNQYFYYPDGIRFNEGTQNFETPTDCSGYTSWPYGYEFAVPYLDGIDASTITNQLVSRNTTYLLGANDTSTTGTLNTTDCQATLLGSNRVKRGENMFTYMETFHSATHKHKKIDVPGVGHDANGMFNSSEFKQFIMDFQ